MLIKQLDVKVSLQAFLSATLHTGCALCNVIVRPEDPKKMSQMKETLHINTGLTKVVLAALCMFVDMLGTKAPEEDTIKA